MMEAGDDLGSVLSRKKVFSWNEIEQLFHLQQLKDQFEAIKIYDRKHEAWLTLKTNQIQN